MSKFYFGLTGAISIYCALGIVSASAADVAPVEPVSSWTGIYVGAGGGYRWADFDVDTVSCDLSGPGCNYEGAGGVTYFGSTNEIYDVTLDDSDFFGTVQAGFDWEFTPGFVLGVMGDIDFGNQLEDDKFNQVNYDGFDNPDAGQAWSAELNEVYTLSARAGFAPTESFLLYGLVGYSFGDAKASYFEGCDFSGDGGPCDDINASNKESLDGWTFGAGAEMKFTDNISGRLEYRYTDLGSIDVSGVSGGQDQFTGDTSTDVIIQSVRATVNFRF
jgi:outer membrane immunogenic protein